MSAPSRKKSQVFLKFICLAKIIHKYMELKTLYDNMNEYCYCTVNYLCILFVLFS